MVTIPALPPTLPNAGIVDYPPRATLGPRVQRDFQLVLVHAGMASVTVDGTPLEIPAGHVRLLLPGAQEFFAFALDRGTRHSWIALPPGRLDPDLAAELARAARCLPISSALQACVDLGREVVALDDAPDRPVLAAVARAALTLYVAEAAHLADARVGRHPIVARARTLARQRACEGLSVRELAAAVGLSPEHLVRLFHRETGTTPGAFLRQERLARAMHLLVHTGLSIAAIAEQAGFATPQHLARAIRQVTGRTPSELRAGSHQMRQETGASPPAPVEGEDSSA